mgnify:CR=1 FL=1
MKTLEFVKKNSRIETGRRSTESQGIEKVRALGKQNHVVYDVKYVFPLDAADIRL